MLLKLFLEFMKIGGLTIGGGYAMISIVKEECVDKNNWIKEDEFYDMLTVSESTPGPIAINMATYIGYKQAGIMGAIVASIGVVFIPVLIIYVVALFLSDFLKFKIVSNAFNGLRAAVSIIIMAVAYGMIKKEYKDSDKKKVSLFLFFVTLILMILFGILNINVNTVYIILIAFLVAFIMLLVNKI